METIKEILGSKILNKWLPTVADKPIYKYLRSVAIKNT